MTQVQVLTEEFEKLGYDINEFKTPADYFDAMQFLTPEQTKVINNRLRSTGNASI